MADRYAYGHTLSELGLVYLLQGRLDLAADHCRRALLAGRELADETGGARAPGLARAHAAAGEPDQARDHWTRSLEHYAALGAPEADEIRKRLSAGHDDTSGAVPDGAIPSTGES